MLELATVTNTFPGLNFVRVNVFDMTADTAAMLKPYVDALTSQGVVVELEDHNFPTVLTGHALNSVVQRYTDWATAFKGNPNVVFGTQNEPVGSSSSIDAEISAIYNAIRATGNNNLVLMDPYAGNSTTGLAASNFTSMTNVAWDIHYYSELSGYSTDLGANESALATEVAGTQGIRSANGAIPVIIGEYGTAAGTNPAGPRRSRPLRRVGWGQPPGHGKPGIHRLILVIWSIHLGLVANQRSHRSGRRSRSSSPPAMPARSPATRNSTSPRVKAST